MQPETPENGETRPTRQGAGSTIPTAIKIDPTLAAATTVCAQRTHDTPWPCPLHGCPWCAVAMFPYVDPEAEIYRREREEHLAALYVDEAGCLICDEILVRAAWAAFPGWECELTCFVQHCTECGRCGQSGRVCRVCGLCLDHQDVEIGSPCEVTRWVAALGKDRVLGYRHQLWNPGTGRWGQ